MKFTIERKMLLDVMALVKRGAEARSPIPILANVLIVAKKEGVTFSATNYDRIIAATCEAIDIKPGALTANAEQIAFFVKNAPDGSQVECEAGKDDRLILRAGRARLALLTLPKKDFPDFSTGEFQHSFEVDGGEFSKALTFVAHAQGGGNDPRNWTKGIHLHEESGKLVVVATDGLSLAKTSLNGQTFPAFTPLILPRDFVADLQAIAERAPSLTLDVSETRLRASSDGVSITMKLLGETYGPYENAIDAVAPRRFSASRISIEAAVVRCASLADGIDRTVKLSLRGGVLALSSSRSESGDVSDEIEVGDGKDFDTGFHVRRLQNALTALKSATEVEALFEDGAPMMLRDAAHPEAVQIIAAQRV